MKHGTADLRTLQDVINAMKGRQVIVIGDIMLDRFVYGEVHRISPESPVPVLTIRNENRMLGGAGNVVSNLAGLGVQAHMLGTVGSDDGAAMLRALLAEKGVMDAGLVTLTDRPTTVKTRFLAAHQQLLRTDFERLDPLPESVQEEILARALKLLPQAGAVILSDYGKGVLSARVIRGVIDAARKHKVPVLVDPKKADYSIYRGASLVTPNRKELAEATGLPTQSDDDIIQAGRTLLERSGIDAVLATRSQDGMSLLRPGQSPVHLRTEALEVFDVSGAGDTVIATVAAAWAAGADLLQAAALANIAGGIVVAKVGTAPVRARELQDVLARKDLDVEGAVGQDAVIHDTTRTARLCDADEAAEIVQRWKARGQTVGFTNGCFDILHPGHVSYLHQARGRCDRLVIGLNTDASIKRLKGADRPVNSAEARAVVLGALASVDMVVLFGDSPEDQDKPLCLIRKLRPDLFFKGGDYRVEQLEEAPLVRSYGGTVEIMPFFEGHSTTATINKMKGDGRRS